MPKCVIFDCDGTLVDSEYLCNIGLVIELNKIGIQENAEHLMAQFRGWKLAHIFECLGQKHGVVLDSVFEQQYRSTVAKLFETELRPIEGAKELLSQLNHPKCVASSGPMHKIRQALQVTNLIQFFDNNLFSAYEVGSWKPEPDLFLHAAAQMGFSPGECLVVEDSLVGIQAAQASRIPAIYYNPTQHYFLPQKGVEQIHHMSELLSMLT